MRAQTTFAKFVELCKALESTTKRTEKTLLIVDFLRSLSAEEIVSAVCFLTGRPFPESDARALDVGGRTLWGINRAGGGQSTLIPKPATILDVYETFDRVANMSGPGSRQRKEVLFDTLLNRLSSHDREYLMRIIFGEMRIGAVDGVVLDALASATSINPASMRRAHMLLGDLSQVAKVALTSCAGAIQNIGVTLFIPIRPMLADMAQDLEEAFKEHEGRTAFEFKYDGARIQIHRKNDKTRIFTRRLTDVTESLPDIVQMGRERIRAGEYLVEGEVVAIGKDQKPLPFQDLMRRFRRVHEIGAKVDEIPLRLYLFDAIYLDGRMLIDLPYDERWRTLQRIVEPDLMAERTLTTNLHEAQEFMVTAIQAGHEGLMAKELKSRYTPGMRGKKWLKIKPAETLDLVIVAADWGSGRRHEWLSNYHLAVRDESSGEYLVVGKTFKGLTDQEFIEITKRLLDLRIRETDYTVYVKPSIVVQVAHNEIQRSPHYQSRFALRFARITRLREDRRPEDVDTIERLQQLYEKQFRYKASLEP